MMPGSEDRWRERPSATAGALGTLLERMTNDFTKRHDSQHFQPGFVPSATPPWTTTSLGSQMAPLQASHSTLGSQMPQMQPTHTNIGSQVSSMSPPHNNIGPQMTPLQTPTTSASCTMPLGSQMGGPGTRSSSVSQDLFTDHGGGRNPLLRSSSDLGLRLSHYQGQGNICNDGRMDGNFSDARVDSFMDSSIDSIDTMLVGRNDSAFFPEVQRGPCVNSGTPPPPMQGDPQGLAPAPVPQPEFSFYSNEHDRFMDGVGVNNITAKFSNFTATLGSLFSPFDSFRSNLNVGQVKSPSVSQQAAVRAVLDTSLPSEAGCSTQCNPSKGGIHMTGTQHSRSSKPSYSDVLSKNTVQESRLNAGNPVINSRSSSSNSNSSSGNLNHPPQSPSPGPTATRPEHPNRNTSGKGKSKGRNSNSIGNNAGNGNGGGIHSRSSEKGDSQASSSRVGLDDFHLGEVGLSNGRITAYEHYDWSENSETCDGFGVSTGSKTSANSPTHQTKRTSIKGELRKNTPEKMSNCCLADEGARGNDQLNNRVSSVQQKQPPRRTSYINNNLNAANLASPTPSSVSGNSSSSIYGANSVNLAHSGPAGNTINPTFHNNNNNDCKSDGNKAKGQMSKEDKKVPVVEEPSTANASGRTSGRSKGTVNGRSERVDRNRESQPKRPAKKRKSPSFLHSELVVAGWAVVKQWVGLAMQAVVWLLTLSADVVYMSTQLFLHMMAVLWAKLLSYWGLFKSYSRYCWSKIVALFRKTDKEERKIPGREKKIHKGLDCNITLPTSGEEAMKRLLACKGKDPYSILGVTQECSDEDIKKYYRRQAFLVHPDKNKQPGAEEAFKIVAHAFEIIGEPEKRREYDARLAEEVQLEGAWGELASLLTRLQEKLDEAANTIRCTNCNKRHRRAKLTRPIYAARHCAECQIHHAAREGDIWAESKWLGLWWRYYACMEGAVYDISEWAACQSENLKHLQANTHSVQYRIVSGKKNPPSKNNSPEFPSDPDLEEFFNNLCKEKFGKSYTSGSSQAGSQQMPDLRKRKGKKKK
ncbi:Cleavage inducing molecular chaperone [Halocaridina rubra]|uniref:Cleavage inducing molecular chaperone n=1 Tax=Halocaridina rubra TaxID=373956 RepID=A0AAN9A5E9_HALRR